ncbi:MAG TPA: isoprenylcysteine carboxylmethyltransferase family protein [Methylocella sp.]|nr:isoprenylcysteine carboxylmethyltransferase family protein [Methylocella sp.]
MATGRHTSDSLAKAASPALRPQSACAIMVRICASAWFLALSAAAVSAAASSFEGIAAGNAAPCAWLDLISEGLVALFYIIIFVIMLLRPEPVSQARRLWPAILALSGSYGAWFIPLLPHGPADAGLKTASALILFVAEALMIYTLLRLGRSFSLLPQARKLVTGGPYAIVRHPLYLAEETAIAGMLLQYAWFAALPFLAFHAAVQIWRMLIEEAVLHETFPEYALYARQTPRILPWIW